MSKKKEHPDEQSAPSEQVEPTEPTEPIAAEPEDLLARLQRVSADYLNYQKRAQRDLIQAREFANEQLIKDLLPILDDMERAIEAARANTNAEDSLLTGMQLVHDNVAATLGRFGLKVIDAAGQPFDPQKHSAMMQQPSGDHPPQTVLQELQKGYQLKGRTIRPCSVIVSTEPPADEPGDESDQPDQPDQPQ